MEAIIAKIALGLVTAAIIGMVKMYSDGAVIKSKHTGLQKELNAHKRDVKADIAEIRSDHKSDILDIRNMIEDRFTKVEALIEKLYTYERTRPR